MSAPGACFPRAVCSKWRRENVGAVSSACRRPEASAALYFPSPFSPGATVTGQQTAAGLPQRGFQRHGWQAVIALQLVFDSSIIVMVTLAALPRLETQGLSQLLQVQLPPEVASPGLQDGGRWR